MSAIMDVSMVVFQSFRQKNPVFFWTHNETQFILLKPYNDAWVRTVVLKSGDKMKDSMWVQTNLAGQTGAFFIERITNLDLQSTLEQILAEVKKPLMVTANDRTS